MWKIASFFCALISFATPCAPAHCQETPSPTTNSTMAAPQYVTPFTGKIVRNKVRLRTQPSLDAPIAGEINRGDLFIIVGETEDFYAVLPPRGTKAYIFRTFVLDNQVEGTRVNIRLKPDLEAPVIAQLNSGDRVNGNVSPQNNKWLEIAPPQTTRFFVSKDLVEKIGDANLLTQLEKRQDEVQQLLNNTVNIAENEFAKPFDEIHFDGIIANLKNVMQNYSDFPQEVAKATQLLKQVEERYLQRKIAYLESKAQNNSNWQATNEKLINEIKDQQDKLAELETQLQKGQSSGNTAQNAQRQQSRPSIQPEAPPAFVNAKSRANPVPARMSVWQPIEDSYYSQWSSMQPGPRSKEEFYQEQEQNSVTLRGLVEPYQRAVKNKPGDYVLVNSYSNLPVAYLYSTTVNLQDYAGHEVTLTASKRPNNNFAFPAYFVLGVE